MVIVDRLGKRTLSNGEKFAFGVFFLSYILRKGIFRGTLVASTPYSKLLFSLILMLYL